MKFDVAVIIINYNTSKFTLKCLNVLVEKISTKLSYQVIVVDNCSKIEDYKNLKAKFPNFKNFTLLQTKKNLGFGGGNNFAAANAQAKYLLFLNNDAFLINDAVSICKNYLQLHTEVGLVSAQNYNNEGKFIASFDHYKGLRRLFFGRGFLEKTNPHKYPSRKKTYTQPIVVNWVNGAFLFMPQQIFNTIGKFDQNIFLYWEEMDLSLRLDKNNLKTVLIPEAKITHIQGASTGNNFHLKKEGLISYLYLINKHFGSFKLFFIVCYLSFTFLLKPKKRPLLKVVWHFNRKKLSLSNNQ